MSGSMRDALAAAFDAAEEREAAPAEEVEPVEAAPAEEPDAPVEEPQEARGDAAPENGAEEQTQASEDGRARDEQGRFAAKAKPDPKAKPGKATAKPQEPAAQTKKPDAQAAPAEGQEPPKEPTAPASKPPAGWGPAAREHWGKLPAEVQREVAKRERETAQVLERTAQERKQSEGARQFASEIANTLRPYEAMIRAESSGPLQAIDSMFRFAHALRSAPPPHKAQLVANLVKTYGVPIEALADALEGKPGQAPPQQYAPPPQPPPQPREFRDPRLDQLLARQEQALQQQYQSEMQKFAETHDFYDDVREDMASFVEIAAKRGVDLPLEEAYNRSIALHPEIQQVLKQRETVKAAATAQAATQRAKAAASSVKPHPAQAAPQASGPKDLRAQIEASWDRSESSSRV